MIYAITGTAYRIGGQKYAVNVHNTGLTYEVTMVGPTEVPKDIITVWIYTHYPERSGPEMYGFLEREAERVFEELVSVPGCGPSKSAIILYHMTTEEVATAIATKNQSKLEKVPMIGPKTAKAIIVHLEGKYPERLGYFDNGDINEHAYLALKVLGYPSQQAKKMIHDVPLSQKFTDAPALVRAALNEFNRRK